MQDKADVDHQALFLFDLPAIKTELSGVRLINIATEHRMGSQCARGFLMMLAFKLLHQVQAPDRLSYDIVSLLSISLLFHRVDNYDETTP